VLSWAVTSIRFTPSPAIAGEPVTVTMVGNGCQRWQPGWTAAQLPPANGSIVVNVSVDIALFICGVPPPAPGYRTTIVAPEPGTYQFLVKGSGQVIRDPRFPSAMVFTSLPVTLTVVRGTSVPAQPIPVMAPLAIGLLGCVLALGGWFELRRRRA
jgi:hypothetical protein